MRVRWQRAMNNSHKVWWMIINQATSPEVLSKADAKEVLEILSGDIDSQIEALESEMDNEEEDED